MPFECQHKLGEYFVAFRAWDIITNLVDYYKEKINASDWYTLAKCDEYATLAREQISKFETEQVPLNNEFAYFSWRDLSKCEKKTVQYQSVINNLGNNLQCAATAALVSTAFFINQTPTIDPSIDFQISLRLIQWSSDYNKCFLKKLTIKAVKMQIHCANYMLLDPENSYSRKQSMTIFSWTLYDEPTDYGRPAFPYDLTILVKEADQVVREYVQSKREVSIQLVLRRSTQPTEHLLNLLTGEME